MAIAKASTSILLSEKRRFIGQSFGTAFQQCSRKMQQHTALQSGESAQLKRHFQFIPSTWSIAALCRQAEMADADRHVWLRADPVYLQAETNGARMMAWDNLGLSTDEQSQILSALRPVFGDFGFELSASSNSFFYIRALNASPIPDFMDAADILGCDLLEYLPKDKTWLALFNECQIILHNHSLNATRVANQQTPINGLWFWGQGCLPNAVQHHFYKVFTDDFMLSAMMSVNHQQQETDARHQLIDARKVRDWQQIAALFDSSKEFIFDFADGTQWHWQPKMKYFFWRNQSLRFG